MKQFAPKTYSLEKRFFTVTILLKGLRSISFHREWKNLWYTLVCMSLLWTSREEKTKPWISCKSNPNTDFLKFSNICEYSLSFVLILSKIKWINRRTFIFLQTFFFFNEHHLVECFSITKRKIDVISLKNLKITEEGTFGYQLNFSTINTRFSPKNTSETSYGHVFSIKGLWYFKLWLCNKIFQFS